MGRAKFRGRGQRVAEPFTEQLYDLLNLENLLGG